MNTTSTNGDRAPMTATRKAALIAGIAYIATFAFSIPVKFGLWKDAIDMPDWILGAGSDAGVPTGAVFEIITALTGIVTAVAVYSVLRRQSQRAALGFVTSRVIEAAVIFVGVLAIMSAFTLRNDVAGTAAADNASLLTTGRALVAVHDWTFLTGPGLMPAFNALCFATVLYRARLVPRAIPTLGLIGAPLLLVSFTATMFGVWDQVSGPALLCTLPIAVWEFSIGVYMTVKGFKASAITDAPAIQPVTSAAAHAAA